MHIYTWAAHTCLNTLREDTLNLWLHAFQILLPQCTQVAPKWNGQPFITNTDIISTLLFLLSIDGLLYTWIMEYAHSRQIDSRKEIMLMQTNTRRIMLHFNDISVSLKEKHDYSNNKIRLLNTSLTAVYQHVTPGCLFVCVCAFVCLFVCLFACLLACLCMMLVIKLTLSLILTLTIHTLMTYQILQA